MEQLAVHDLFHDAAHGEIVAAQQSARTEDHHQDEHQRVDDHAVAVEAAGGLGQDGQNGSGEDGAQHGAHAAQNHHDQDLDGLHEAEGGGVQNADVAGVQTTGQTGKGSRESEGHDLIISSLDAAALGSDLVVADGEDGTAMAALHHGMDEEAGDDHTEEDIGEVGVLGDVLEALGAVEQAVAQQSCLEKFQRLFFVALLSVLAVGAFAQSKTVSGTVLDKTGESVIGASVVVKGTTNGTITDFDGKFTLTNVPESGTIEISFVGYKTVNVAVKGQSTIKVILEEDTETLEEVVVVGYGVQKKSDVTGALTQVSSKTIRERPVQNALQAMQGKAAGVQITSNNRPGELGDVRIRGSRSLNASNDPLYVIDGIPMSVGSMADVNPNDIESMEILKDDSATAIYGSRGANGVILITTKKGKTGKVTINYDGTVSFSKIHSMTDWMNSGELIDWNRQANVNAGAYTGKYGNAPDPDIDGDAYFGGVSQYPYLRPVFNAAFQFNADGTPVLRDATQYEKEVLGYADRVPVYNSANIPTTPWTDYVTRTSLTHNHQISLSAGTEKSKLYMSLAYLDQESPMKDQDYKRYTVNMNGEIQATEFLKVGMGINASHSIKNYGIVSNFSNTTAKDSYGLATSLMPYAPAFDENGKILSPDDGPSRHNVLLNIDEALNETRYYGFMLSSFAELDFGKIWTPLEGAVPDL